MSNEKFRPVLEGYDGEAVVGKDEILLSLDDNLISQATWAQQGFAVAQILDQAQFRRLQTSMSNLVFEMVLECGVKLPKNPVIEDYHKYIAGKPEVHLKIAKWGLPLRLLDIDIKQVTEKISELCKANLKLRRFPLPDKDEDGFGFRVVRPQSSDHNPFHRDGWLDLWKGTVNIWIPIAGCSSQSSLQLVPGSHLWSESEIARTPTGATMGGRKYHVPAVVSVSREFKPIAPAPKDQECIVFSPYIIHGGGKNTQTDISRVSIELRFERVT